MRNKEPPDEDIENIQKAVEILVETSDLNPNIPGRIWNSAVLYLFANGIKNAGRSYKDYCRDIDQAKEFYKILWEKE